MNQALRARTLPKRKPTPDDAPPLTTFPMTKAAAEALRLDRAKRRKSRSP